MQPINNMQPSPHDSADTDSTRVPTGKVPIPRLKQDTPPPKLNNKPRRMSRVGKACTLCRIRKIKCSGDMPKCDACRARGLECIYDISRRDRLTTARMQNDVLVNLLKELLPKVGNDEQQIIDDVLTAIKQEKEAENFARPTAKRRADSDHSTPDESNYPASVGSNEDQDLIDEDFTATKESRETGYVGVSSEVRWLQSVEREMTLGDSETQPQVFGPPGADQEAIAERSKAFNERKKTDKRSNMGPMHENSFYLDADSLDLPDIEVNMQALPIKTFAKLLLSCYMETVHRSFPILPDNFEEQLDGLYYLVEHATAEDIPAKWLAVLNLVFAIGSRYSHIIDADWQGDERDHLLYMTRAIRLLGQGKDTDHVLLAAPHLNTIQATGLLSFYYMTIGHVSRAWVMVGTAIRLAIALGMHLRNEDENTSPKKKETQIRMWWSLHSLESLLGALTGRPGALPYEDSTVDMPRADATEQSHAVPSHAESSSRSKVMRRESNAATDDASSSATYSHAQRRLNQPRSFLDAHFTIGVIVQKTTVSLYAPRCGTRAFDYIQATILDRSKELAEWKDAALPMQDGKLMNRFGSQRDLTSLRISYWSAKILIGRMCVCRTERRMKGQTPQSAAFNQKTAELVVKAAQEMVDLLPDQPNPKGLYKVTPWWSLVHHLMQAMCVLLLELAFEGAHTSEGWGSIPPYIQKLVRWFRAMRTTDPVAGRAYDLVTNCLRKCHKSFETVVRQILDTGELDHEPGVGYHAPDLPRHHHNQPQMADSSFRGAYSDQYPGFASGSFQPHPAFMNPRSLAAPQYTQAHSQSTVPPVQPHGDVSQFNNWGMDSSAFNSYNTGYSNQDLFGFPDLSTGPWSLAGLSSAGSQLTTLAHAGQQQGHGQGQTVEGYTAYHSQNQGHVPEEYAAYHSQHQGQGQGQIPEAHLPHHPPNPYQAQGQNPDDYQQYDPQHQA